MHTIKILAIFSFLALAGSCAPLASQGYDVVFNAEYESGTEAENPLIRRGGGMIVDVRADEKGSGIFADEKRSEGKSVDFSPGEEKRSEEKGTGFFADEKRGVDGHVDFSPSEKRGVDGHVDFSPNQKRGALEGHAVKIYLPVRE